MKGYKVECTLNVGDDKVVPGVGMARQVKVASLVEVKHTQLKHQAIVDMVIDDLGLVNFFFNNKSCVYH